MMGLILCCKVNDKMLREHLSIKEQYYFNRCESDSYYEEIDVLEATKDQVEMEFAFGYTDEQGNDYDMHRVHVILTSDDVIFSSYVTYIIVIE